MKRALLIAAAAILLAAISIYWIGQQRSAARRLAEWENEHASDALGEILAKTFEFERANVTLAKFAKLISAKSGVQVEIDKDGIASDAAARLRWPNTKAEDIAVTVPRGEFSLHDVMRTVLTRVMLEADVRGRKLVITTWANSDNRREYTVIYPVLRPEPAGLIESDWEQLFQANINGHAKRVPGAIIVVANRDNHERVHLVIESIRALRGPAPQAIAIPTPFSDAELKIRAELGRETAVDFVEQPLKDVVNFLSELHKIPLILAADKLQEASVGLDVPVTKTLRGLSLRSALSLILKDLELAFTVRDQALIITTSEDAQRERTIAYQVRDLAEVQPGFADIDSLAELIRAALAPDRWGDGNGGGPRSAGDDWLVIDQSDQVHEDVAALLATLRQMLAVEGHGPSQPIRPMGEMEKRIREVLKRPIELEFKDRLLKDAVIDLSELLVIPVVMSFRTIKEAYISPDTPIAYKTAAIPAHVALEQILKTIKLDFVVRDEVLQITTPEDVESMLVTRVYDTRAILKQLPEQQLRHFVMANAWPGSWNYTGGPGNVDVFRGLLIVSHTDRVHDEVERLVEALTDDLREAN